MSYNRWMPVQCSSELYHHGVKGMKWGKHLFGNGADIQAGAGGGGGGGLLEEEPDDEELKKAKALYEQLYSELCSMSPEDMARIGNVKLGAMYKTYYAALDDYKAKQADYDKRKAEYEKTLSYKIKNPGETIKKALDKADSAVKTSTKFSNKPAGPKKTTLREAQNAQKNPHPNLPRSRKRNVTGKGTGVHIGQTVLPPEPKPLMLITDTNRPTSRKRKVTGKGTGVHVHGPGLNGGRKR